MSVEQIMDVVAELVLGLLSPGDLPEAAVVALEGGLDSPALLALASMPTDADPSKASAMFDSALTELNVPVPSPRDAVVRLARGVAVDIVDGTIAPYAGARRVWELARRIPADQIHELDPFIYAASEWEERPEDRIHFERGIMEEARALLSL